MSDGFWQSGKNAIPGNESGLMRAPLRTTEPESVEVPANVGQAQVLTVRMFESLGADLAKTEKSRHIDSQAQQQALQQIGEHLITGLTENDQRLADIAETLAVHRASLEAQQGLIVDLAHDAELWNQSLNREMLHQFEVLAIKVIEYGERLFERQQLMETAANARYTTLADTARRVQQIEQQGPQNCQRFDGMEERFNGLDKRLARIEQAIQCKCKLIAKFRGGYAKDPAKCPVHGYPALPKSPVTVKRKPKGKRAKGRK